MKKLFLLLVLANALPIVTKAQDDDLYFVPSKVAQENSNDNKPAYYVGSDRKVDEYNRRGQFRSKYQMIGADSLGNDIISFGKGTGVYPDSSYVDTTFYYSGSPRMEDEDYAYTRYMSRWDGFYNPWFYRYWGPYRYGWYGAWYNSWYNPWYGAWYDPWFDPWFDPWYYGYGWGWNGWYSPWYYGYGWGYPYWGGWYGGGYVNHYAGGNPRGLAGNRTWSYGRPASGGNGGFGRTYSNSGNSGRSSTYTSRSAGNRSFGSRSRSSYPTSTYNNSGFGSSTRSSVGSSGSSGSFGGGRSSGGGFGGGHSSGGGGGSFGGGRR